mgnify:CR=1 FL=1
MFALMICFIVVVLLVVAFCVTVVIRDIVLDERARKNGGQAPATAVAGMSAPATAEVPTADEAAEPEPDEEETTEEEETGAEEDEAELAPGEERVLFSAGSETLDEKYLALSPESKGYYDEIVRFANTVEGSKRYKNASFEEYKVGKNRLVRIKIKRDVVVCELVIPNLAFKNYLSENRVEVKQAPTIIRVVDEATLSAVKDSMQIAINAIEEERTYRKEQAKLRRRERRAAAGSAEKVTDGKEE